MALQHLHGVAAATDWLRGAGVTALTSDSRRLRAGEGFVAWPGVAGDGRRHVAAALAAGAAACLVEAQGAEDCALPVGDARIAAVDGLKAAAGPIAARVLGDPSAELAVVAITGTNGKSSTAWWTAQALGAVGRRAGVVGTLGAGLPPVAGQAATVTSTGLTTPDPVALQAIFRGFVDGGCTACAIEASSIGIVEERLAGTHVAVAVHTNLTQDHLDYHGAMAAYGAAKRRLFAWEGLAAAAINVDDAFGAALDAELAAERPGVDRWSYAVDGNARLVARDVRYDAGGLCFTLHEGQGQGQVDDVGNGARRAAGQTDGASQGAGRMDAGEVAVPVAVPVRTSVIGAFNVANLLAVAGSLRAFGVPLADVAAALATVTPVPGRMQRVPVADGGPEVIVDYAHTPDALDKALTALRPFAAARGGRLVCVFGCGGDRDAAKRPLMGAIAARLADRVVVTSDNPRGEAPEAILRQILAGAGAGAGAGFGVRVGTGAGDGDGGACRTTAAKGTDPHRETTAIVDRRAAITVAVTEADAADVVLIAGKGHETTQEIAGRKLPFDDAAVAADVLAARGVPA